MNYTLTVTKRNVKKEITTQKENERWMKIEMIYFYH